MKTTLHTIEKYQGLIYLLAMLCGFAVGMSIKVEHLSTLLWPLLVLLLYTTFVQVPMAHVRQSFSDVRFIGAALTGNFLVIPLILWFLVKLLPYDPLIHLSLLLVLLMPCADWFVSFTYLGKGDVKRSIAFLPISLLLQLFLLPLYLYLFLGEAFFSTIANRLLIAFLSFILLPLLAALLTQEIAFTLRKEAWIKKFNWIPITLLVLIIFVVSTQVKLFVGFIEKLLLLGLAFLIYLLIAAFLSKLLSITFKLDIKQGRTLAFSFGTRNSFVVFPIALSLPPSYELVIAAVVLQPIVELMGMFAYLWLIPQKLFHQ